MKKLAKDLEFISVINRDGSGTTPVDNNYLEILLTNPLTRDTPFEIRRLSYTEDTFIAFGFNAFVVKLKK
jgi:hypothetical protein